MLSGKDELGQGSGAAVSCLNQSDSRSEDLCGGNQDYCVEVGSEGEVRIIDFIVGGCDATHYQQFVSYWLVTQGNPCLVCGRDKPACGFFGALVKKGVFSESGDLM